jgi:hypothetical protein
MVNERVGCVMDRSAVAFLDASGRPAVALVLRGRSG